MKKVFFLIIVVGVVLVGLLPIQAQNYNNEWIDYSKTYFKIKAAHNALYRIPQATLIENDIPLQGAQLKVFHMGQEIPIYVSTNGLMQDDDYVVFYGHKNDGELDGDLFENPDWQLNPNLSLFSDTAAYFLTWSSTELNERYETINNNLSGDLPPKETHFWYADRQNIKNIFFAGEPYRNLGGVNNYLSDYGNGEGFVGNHINENSSRTYTANTPFPYTALGGNFNVKTKVVGRSDDYLAIPDHRLTIWVDEEAYVDTLYEGYENHKYSLVVPVSSLGNPQTAITYTCEDYPSTVNKASVVYIDVTYPREFNFGNAKRFFFELDNTNDKYIEVTGFDGGTTAVLYDLTNKIRLIPQKDGDVYKMFLPQGSSTAEKRQLLLVNTAVSCDFLCTIPNCFTDDPNCPIMEVSSLIPVNLTDFDAAVNEGDYIILTHPFLKEGTVNHVERYRNYRASPNGGGHDAVVVSINDLYTQFSFGIEKHPLAIQNFVRYAYENWATRPEFLLLLGKSISYDRLGLGSVSNYNANLVPTYGHQPSDGMLVARGGEDYRYLMSVGRVSAYNGEEVGDYLDKVIEYETDLPCDLEARKWKKDAIHLAGGFSLTEAQAFLEYLNTYKAIYEDSLLAGEVLYTYTKASADIIETPELDAFINDGLGVISFVGHSSGQYWDVDIKEPQEYTNYGRYPFIVTSSCFVGNVHDVLQAGKSMAEDYTLAQGLGSIAFLATVHYGFPSYLDRYVKHLYHNFSRTYYNEPMGYNIKKTVDQLYDEFPGSEGTRYTVQSYAFAGDPAVAVASFDRPEYMVLDGGVFFNPPIITANLDSFALNVVVTNAGAAISDSLNVEVRRELPNGEVQIAATGRFSAPVYIDTLTLYVYTTADTIDVSGDNYFTVHVDYDDAIEEDCEDNNALSVSTFVFSDLLVPIHPCDFSIVCNPDVVLKASTGQPFLAALPYKIEIDTSGKFNTPLDQIVLNSESGVIEWSPNIELEDGRVYYWRASQVPADDDDYNWQMNSFIFLDENCTPGWNQSHYKQFKQNKLENITIDSLNHMFEYYGYNNLINASNAFYSYPDINVDLNVSNNLLQNTCLKGNCKGGISFVVFKPSAVLEPIYSEMVTENYESVPDCDRRGTYGNNQCGFGVKYGIEFYTGSDEQVANMVDFMENGIPEGYYVLSFSIRNHRINTNDSDEPINAHMAAIHDFYNELGATDISDIDPNYPFIVFGRKGAGGSYIPSVEIPTDSAAIFNLEVNVLGRANSGSMKSTIIGPAKSWHTLARNSHSLETASNDDDQIGVNVYGVQGSDEQLLFENVTDEVFDLSTVSANEYPILRLEMLNKDSTSFTPAQLDYWRVYYQMVGELAIDKQRHFVFNSDTLLQGEAVSLELAVTNVTGVDFDSLLVQYTIINNNVAQIVQSTHQAPILGNSSNITSFSYSTEGFVGNNTLIVEINPDQEQSEKMQFNNVIAIPFFVKEDEVNPVVDVTFDGRHIVDGDIVSAKPSIVVKAHDDSKFLALNDINDFKVTIKYPNETGEPTNEELIDLNAIDWVVFTPASSSNAANGNNSATIELLPEFTLNGTYELIIRAYDRTGNVFDGDDFVISFKVETTPMLSNVFNYPNPFTTATQFVFTLTGSDVPEFMKIQIMTVSGKVVREITQDELGTVRIGNNISDFTWDGTDEFGNILANGLYLYRISATLNGQSLEKYETNTDSFFNKGIGKMYLMR